MRDVSRQQGDLSSTAASSANAETDRGPCCSLVSRTANEMADRLSPGISAPRGPIRLASNKTDLMKERSCPNCSAGSTGRKTITMWRWSMALAASKRNCASVMTPMAIGICDLLADHGDTPQDPIPVAIETGRGLLVACLHATGRAVYAINPLAAARYRERHTVSRRKSDAGDAIVLANILRTDAYAHRPIPANTELGQAITVLARAQQDAVWNRQQVANQLRSHLREYYPAALLAFQHQANGGLTRADARAILAIAPTPSHAAKLTRGQLRAALKRSGRTRDFDTAIDRIQAVFRADYLRQPAQVESAMGHQMLALLRQLDAACAAADDLAAAAIAQFDKHPDAGSC